MCNMAIPLYFYKFTFYWDIIFSSFMCIIWQKLHPQKIKRFTKIIRFTRITRFIRSVKMQNLHSLLCLVCVKIHNLKSHMIYFVGPWFWTDQLGGGGQCGPYLAKPPVRLLSAVSRVGTQSGVEGCHIRHPKAPSYHIPKLFLLASSRFIWIQHSTSTRSLCTKLYSFAERWYREIESCGLFLFCYQPPLKEESWEDLKMSEM